MRTVASFLFLELALYGARVGMKTLIGADSVISVAASTCLGAGLVLVLCQIIRGQ